MVCTAVASQPRTGVPSTWKSRRRAWNKLAFRSSDIPARGSSSSAIGMGGGGGDALSKRVVDVLVLWIERKVL